MPDAPLADLLRDHRQRRDLTIDVLAERSRVSDRTISDIERGVSLAPHRATISAIADGLALDEVETAELVRAARQQRRARSGHARVTALAPHRLADFTGRDDEIARVLALLDADRRDLAPLVVISGAPGFGKTTVALEALDRIETGPAKLFVDLDGFSPRPLSALEVLNALLAQMPDGVGIVPPTTVDEAVARWTTAATQHPPIVLLDNAAHESQILPVLSVRSAGVVVTSRRNLAALEDASRISLDPLDEDASVRLLERLIPEFQREPDDLKALVELADRVPLALRIVGNRIASRPAWMTGDFIARLRSEETRLRQLVAGDLAVESAVSLSYDFLEPRTAELFRAISVIHGGTFDARLAAATIGGDPVDSESRLDDLTDLGMLEARGGDRYRLHDLLRLYARSRLEDEVGTAGMLEREATVRSWLLGSLERAGAWYEPSRSTDEPGASSGLSFADQESAGAWVRGETAHWWPALQTAAALGEHATVVDVADALHWLSDVWLKWGRWYDLFSLAVAAAEALGDKRLEAMHLGYVAWTEMEERANLPSALATARRALAAADIADDDQQRGWANFYIASVCRLMEDREVSAAASKEAIAQFHAVGDSDGEAQSILQLAHVRSEQGEAELTIRELQAFLPQVRSGSMSPLVQRITEFSLHRTMSVAYRELGQWARALDELDSAIAIARAMDDTGRVMTVLRGRIAIHVAAKDAVAADAAVTEALEVLGDNVGEAFMLSQRALVKELRAQLEE